MIICEYFYKQFDAQGSDEYLDGWATDVDQLAENDWEVVDSVRSPERNGLWTVVLCKSPLRDRPLESA